MFTLRSDSNKFNFHAFLSPSTFIRKTDIEIKDETEKVKKTKRKRGRNKERNTQKIETIYVLRRT